MANNNIPPSLKKKWLWPAADLADLRRVNAPGRFSVERKDGIAFLHWKTLMLKAIDERLWDAI